jgi:hypothetical protein
MKKLNVLIYLLIFGLFSFTSCESVEEAQKTADQFYDALNNIDEKAMEKILDQETVIEAGIKNQFYDVFDKHEQDLGKVTNHERYAFSTNVNNGATYVTLKFKCKSEKIPTVYEKLKFIKRDDGYKLYEFVYNTDKTVIDKAN